MQKKIRWRRHRATATLMCKNVDHAAECTDAQAKIPARRGGRTYSLLLGGPRERQMKMSASIGSQETQMARAHSTRRVIRLIQRDTPQPKRTLVGSLARNSPTYTSRRNVITGSEDLHCDATVYISPWKVICCQSTYTRVYKTTHNIPSVQTMLKHASFRRTLVVLGGLITTIAD